MPDKKNLIVNNKPTTVVIDGHGISVLKDDMADVVFFQVVGEDGNNINAQAVASLRLTLAQLEGLSKAIDDSIKKHRSQKR